MDDPDEQVGGADVQDDPRKLPPLPLRIHLRTALSTAEYSQHAPALAHHKGRCDGGAVQFHEVRPGTLPTHLLMPRADGFLHGIAVHAASAVV